MMNTLVKIKGNVRSLVPSLLIILSQVFSPWTWLSLGRTMLNCVFFLISFHFRLVYEVIDLLACLRSSVRISVFLNN